MKKFLIPIAAAFFLFLGCALPVAAQQAGQQQDVATIIYQKDSLFWEAYNNCNVPGMQQYFTEDVEFYHDKGGVFMGLDKLSESLKSGLCGKPGYKLRRAAVGGTVKVFPMYSGGTAYGAIISGEHNFYVTDGGKPEYLDGLAKFAQLWVLRNGEWKMSRVLSYDHAPVTYQNKRKEVPLSQQVLKGFAGTYEGGKVGTITVTQDAAHLVLSVGGKTYALFAENDHSFFVKDRDIIFEFSPGTTKTLTIREGGNVVEAATMRKL